MIIENIINKDLMQDNTKILCKYNVISRQKYFNIISIIMIVCGIILLLCSFIIFRIYYLLCGIFGLIYPFFMRLRFSRANKKVYNLLNSQNLKLFENQDYVTRKYIFDKRDLLIEIDNGNEKKNLKFSFNNYYKLWIESKNKVIVIQFNKEREKKIVIINCDNTGDFRNYCLQNHIKYSLVSK